MFSYWRTASRGALLALLLPQLALAASQSFSAAGTYTFTVPSGVTSIHAYLWGAAGASGSGAGLNGSYYGAGGAGGYSEGTIAVSAGQQFTVTVGSGGANGTSFYATTPRGVGGGGVGSGGGGGGGGMSGMFSGGSPLLIAGGGGAGAAGGSGSSFSHYAGGAGGGSAAQAGSILAGSGVYTCTTTGYDDLGNPIQSCSYGSMGQGGTQYGGGAHGTGGYGGTGGSYTQGGDVAYAGCYAGGGGGGGYYGGGSGSSSDYGCYSGLQNSGGGGSGYVAPSVQGGYTAAGAGMTPPQTGSAYYNGTAGRGNQNNNAAGVGGDGLAVITWTAPAPATCAVTFDQNPIAQGSATTLRWTSQNADAWVYINNIGYVAASGAATISPSASTDYSCEALGNGGTSGWHAFTAYVAPPPAVSISTNQGSIKVGQSANIHTTYAPGTYDTMVYTALNEIPPGQGEATVWGYGPQSPHDYTFTPTAAGSYVFKPYIYTSYFGWYSGGQQVTVTVTNAAASATCSVWFNQNPTASGGSTTMHWSSTRADSWVYIDNYGYSYQPAGSVTVAPSASTDYSCIASGSGGSDGWHTYGLTVIQPPSMTISADAASLRVGQSTGVHATYAAQSGDTLSHAKLTEIPPNAGPGDVMGYGAASRYDFTFTPASAGSYVFAPYSETTYFPAWVSGGSVTVTVTNAAPTVNFVATPLSIQRGQTAQLTWSSTNASSCTGTNFSAGGAANNSSPGVPVVPANTTTYALNCTGTGGSASGAQTVTVTCPVTYACSGNTIVRTNADCSTTNIQPSCQSPSFCSTGSSQCLNAAPQINQQLRASPALIRRGQSSKLFWNVSNVSGCSVTGGGGAWAGSASPINGQDTGALSTQTTYTLSCTPLDGSMFTPETTTVRITPTYNQI